MKMRDSTRREFIQGVVATGAMMGVALPGTAAGREARVVGANDRISIGLIGCGGRGRWILENMVKPANANTDLVAVCDIWKHRQETYPDEAEKLFGRKPKVYPDYRQLLEDRDVDAVIIATPDHQHCGQTIDAVQAGKHVYVEKPIAPLAVDLPALNRCRDVVKESKMVVQHGTQGVSGPGAQALKAFIAEKKLGKLFRVESSESLVVPYWVNYKGPQTEGETNWKDFLYNRPNRVFNAHLHACWMGYYEFTSAAIGGWMSHFINMVHFVTGCGMPVAATAFGGRYSAANDARCDAPDQVTVVIEYAEGFHTQFVSHFGSTINSEATLFLFEKGAVRCGFGHDIGNPSFSSEGVNDGMKEQTLLETKPPYPGQAHVTNWFECIRNGGQPNANMDFGYMHGIAVILGDQAYAQHRRVVFDEDKREVKLAT